MHSRTHPNTWVEIDLNALGRNVRRVQERAGGAEVIGVVKADAYGHGAVEVSGKLVELGVERLAVATVDEGIELREAGIDVPILVLVSLFPGSEPAYLHYDLTPVIASEEAVSSIASARFDGTLRLHVEVETGMHRLGIAPRRVPDVLTRLSALPGVQVEGIMTHLAESKDTSALRQVERLDRVLDGMDSTPPFIHIANTGGLYHVPEAVMGRDAVRIGGALYGLSPDPPSEEGKRMEWVMRLVSRVVRVESVPKNESVSYGATWTAPSERRIATIACGYGDGYPRALSNRGKVGVAGRLCPVVGLVCMDMMMVDVSAVEAEGGEVNVGDRAILFGPEMPDLGEVACAAGTIAYSLTCGVTARVPRVYLRER